ncbi:MAG: Sua5/YciO/YrdC/YwlC family protein [Chromatiales bacterium]|nr:Sua5/YciO/YrdC/YwlC family protein [Chromatiales bacterium]
MRQVLNAGGVIAYPTEGVYGLGCDPHNPRAVQRLLDLKGREAAKGLILIAADPGQLVSLIQPPSAQLQTALSQTWPGPVTWLLPAAANCPSWLRGRHATLAVRVTAHPLAAELCRAAGGPLVSTSANLSGRVPARSAIGVYRRFGEALDWIVDGPVGGLRGPTEIRDGLSGRVIRPGPSAG